MALIWPCSYRPHAWYVAAAAGICREHGKTYAVYLITVTRRTTAGAGAGAAAEEAVTWDVYRRYSDFYELHQIIQDKVSANVSYAVVDYMMLGAVNLSFIKTS